MSRSYPSAPITYALAFSAVNSEYDGGKNVNEITATSLLTKSIRDLVKSIKKIPKEEFSESIRIKAAIGSLIHGAIESKWEDTEKAKQILLAQGYDSSFVENLNVKFENRAFKEIEINNTKYIISGKYDFVINGKVIDLKTTSTYIVETGIKDSDYRMQLSIYRWLNPEDITEDVGEIHAYFRDYRNISEATRAKRSRPYPTAEVECLEYQLHSIDYVDKYVNALLRAADFFITCLEKEGIDLNKSEMTDILIPDEEALSFEFNPLSGSLEVVHCNPDFLNLFVNSTKGKYQIPKSF